MTKFLLAISATALFVASGGCTRGTPPEQAFWKWFERNEPALFDFDLEKSQDGILDELAFEIHKVDSNLTFEFGPKEDGRREFTISADGIRKAFPKVEKLYAAAPSLPRWHFVKFRQRRKPSDLSYGGVTVRAEAVSVLTEPDGQKLDITVFIPGYSEASKDTYDAIAFLFLDQALGEYDVEMHLGEVSIKAISQAPPKAYSFAALPKVFDASIARR